MVSPFLQRERWVAENALAVAMRDNYPVSPGHTLVVPRRIVATMWDCTPDELRAMWELVTQQKHALDGEYHPDGFNVGVNCGEVAGQTVPHAHVHIIPRYAGDHPDPRGGVRAVIPHKAGYNL
ncbi:MAG: HIT family protein [Hyphomicrobiaceae bacterium]|nr:MAG: HIT family protein [Hyphomicrobiaceae bacterium]